MHPKGNIRNRKRKSLVFYPMLISSSRLKSISMLDFIEYMDTKASGYTWNIELENQTSRN